MATVTVGELVARLEDFDSQLRVVIAAGSGEYDPDLQAFTVVGEVLVVESDETNE